MSDTTTESERLFTIEDMEMAFRAGGAREYYNLRNTGTEEEVPEFLEWIEEYMQAKANDNGKDSASGVRVNALVSWLKQRKREVDKKWAKAQEDGDKRASKIYQDLYRCYANVIGNIIMHNKEAN